MEDEIKPGIYTKETYDQADKVLNDYFVIWTTEIGLSSIDETSMPLLTQYIKWRRKYHKSRSSDYTYIRNGKKIQSSRPSIHFKPLSGAALNKEFNAINKFFHWCYENELMPVALKVPREPENTKKKIRPSLNDHNPDRRRNDISLDEIEGEKEVNNWITVNEFKDLLTGAKRLWLDASFKWNKNQIKYKTQYRNRKSTNPNGFSTELVKWRSFYGWLIIMANTGMRPVEFRILKWGQLKHYQLQNGEDGLEVWVAGKGFQRPIILRKNVRHFFAVLATMILGVPLEEAIEDPKLREKYIFPIQDYTFCLQEAGKMMGIRKHLTQYTLRHTFINWQFLYTTQQPIDVATISGNSHAVVVKYYRNITPFILAEREKLDRKDEIMNILPGSFHGEFSHVQGKAAPKERDVIKRMPKKG